MFNKILSEKGGNSLTILQMMKIHQENVPAKQIKNIKKASGFSSDT